MVCVHPGWPILRTWPVVRESWKRILEGPGRNQFILTNEASRLAAGPAAIGDLRAASTQRIAHDVAPARELGLNIVWINRLGEVADPVPDRELPDLSGLPDVLDDFVPAPA